MAAIFHLFRLKVERDQPSLFDVPQAKPRDLILEAIEEKPSEEIRKGHHWKIGNLEKISDDFLFFALGKITQSTRETYDEETHTFKEEDLQEAPYTYVAIDLKFQICAIAHKTKISPRVHNIASSFKTLLNHSNVSLSKNVTFVLSEINDPEEFIEMIRKAYAITEFKMSFGLPNPWDVDKQFHEPMELLLQESHGNQGSTSIKGDALDAAILEEMSRSAASTGQNAQAKIKSNSESRPVIKKLRGNPATFGIAHEKVEEDKKTLFDEMRSLYLKIRGSDQGQEP